MSSGERPARVRDYIPYLFLLTFLVWEAGMVHSLFQLTTPLLIVDLVGGLLLIIYFSWPRFESTRVLGIPLFFMLFFMRPPLPYILFLLAFVFCLCKNEALLKTIFIISPFALAEGMGLAIDARMILLCTLFFTLIAARYDLLEAAQAKVKPLIKGMLYISLILLLISVSPVDPLASKKSGNIAYDAFHHNIESPFFQNDTLTHTFLRYLDSIGYKSRLLNETFTPEALSGISILIIETPEKRYTTDEIAAITDFVNKGGGLFILGDHTNIYDCYLNLNPLLHRFGLHLNFDYSMLWEPHFPSLMGIDSTEETAGATLGVNRSDNLIFYSLKYTTWGDEGDWAASNHVYMGDIAPGKMDRYGVLPICAGANFGRGRVIAIANSDSMSGPNLLYNYDFIGRAMHYLNEENSILRSDLLRGLLAILVLFGLFRAGLPAVKPFIVSAILVLLLVQVEAAISMDSDPANKIALDVGHANIEGYGAPHQYKNVFFAIFAQHYGFNPILVEQVPADLRKYGAYVTMGPTKAFGEQERGQLRDYVQGGGTLIIFDGYHTETAASQTNDAANSLLQGYEMHLNGAPLGEISYQNNTTWGFKLPYAREMKIQVRPGNDTLMKGIDEIIMYSAEQISGGHPLAYYNLSPVIAQESIGRGRVIVIADHTVFQNIVEYEPVFRYPDEGLKKLMENLFISLGGREQNGI